MICDAHPLISARLRRQYLGIEADAVAQRLGIKRTSYLRYERGERRVYFDHAIAIANILECTTDDLTRMPSAEEVSELYAKSQERKVTPIDDTTGELIGEPAIVADATILDNPINKAEGQADGIVVDAHAHAHTTNTSTSDDLAAALAGWDDSE